jgi:hypothetical protein
MKNKYYNQSRSRRKTGHRRPLFNTQVRHLLKWLIEIYGISSDVWDPSCRYMWFIQHMYLHKGLKTTIERIKEDRLKVLQYLAGEIQKGTGLTHDGLPKKLNGLIPYIKENRTLEIKFILTLLYSLRRFNLPLDPKLETVTSPSKAHDYEWMFKYFPDFSKAVCSRLPRRLKNGKLFLYPIWEGYHLTTKSGPTGDQALVSSLQDLVNIPESLTNSIKIFGGLTLSEKMDTCRRHVTELSGIMNQPLTGRKSFRKLLAIPDSEGKTRLIAIGDYWSQTCLKPLHSYLNTVLKSIPQDQTFNQGFGLKELPFNSETTYYSFDLSAFTDRLPIKILIGLLTCNYGEDIALAWYDIIAGYSFDYKDPKGLKFNNIRYNVGNPMGFYTSWPLTTLCHHFLIYVCCRELGSSWKTAKYRMLGDDIVIFDDSLAQKYQEIINLIGMDIQLQKSHIGKSLFEFAKRLFTPNGEVSPFSIKAGLSESKSYFGFIELLNTNFERGWTPVPSWREAVSIFYRTSPKRFRRKSFRVVEMKIERSLLLFKRLRGYDEVLNLIRTIQSHHDYPQLSCNMVNKAKAILVNCIVRSFEESASSYYGDIELRLERALMFYSAGTEDKTDVVYAHPYAFVYGRYVEEAYLSQMKRAYDFDVLYGGEWLPYYRTIKASDANIIFSNRNYIKQTSSNPILLKKLLESCKELAHSEYLS